MKKRSETVGAAGRKSYSSSATSVADIQILWLYFLSCNQFARNTSCLVLYVTTQDAFEHKYTPSYDNCCIDDAVAIQRYCFDTALLSWVKLSQVPRPNLRLGRETWLGETQKNKNNFSFLFAFSMIYNIYAIKVKVHWCKYCISFNHELLQFSHHVLFKFP